MGRKVTLLTLPIAIGAAAAVGLAFTPRTEPLYAAVIFSCIAVVGCIAAGIIMLALRTWTSK
jgi:Na+/melibiose symporter-like transporter